ncbi:MAG: thioredoxin domain-containing protein [Limimaricola sp.]|uniref:DsbA family protein n=1 Tax=Limimaricola sp. TaxID=2211665 RepID=UPI001DDF59CC|nr:DsbA family protein [Limimaricola sp.]MBI1418411.1 thioredoxin domain-containing protein [Limimaricola sp.]
MTIARLAALAAFLAAWALPAAATDLTQMTDADRAAFRAEVRAYLLDHPEVLMEAINELDQRQQQAAAVADQQLVQDNASAIFNDGHSWVGGNPDGDITMVEFMDYRCGYCKRAFPDVDQLLKTDGNIRYIVKEFPILGPQSVLAAQFAIAVKQIAGDETYATVHNALMGYNSDITMASLGRMAQTLGLDMDAISAKMNSPEVAAVINANRQLAGTLQITGTPTFVVKDQMLRGYLPLAQMEQMVSQIRSN